MIFYTYYSYEQWGRGYIGYRKCPEGTTPEMDNYFGSFSDKTFEPTEKIILGIHETKREALRNESLLHEFFQVDVNLHFANKIQQKHWETWNQSEPWNKGKKGLQQAWNKGLHYSDSPCYKGERFTWVNSNSGVIEAGLSVKEMHDKYPELFLTHLYGVKNRKGPSYRGWYIKEHQDNQQPDEQDS